MSSVFKEELGVQQFDENTFIPILNVDMGGGTTDFTYTTLNRLDGVWTLQRVYSEGVHFGGDHLDKRLLQEVLRQFATLICAGDEYAYTQVEKLWKMLKYSSFESFRSSHKIHGMTREEEEEFKRLYYALEMMLLKLEKIKVKNTIISKE